MNKPSRCARCGCARRFHDDNGCTGHVKCKTPIGEGRFFIERNSRSKSKPIADYEVKRSDQNAIA